MKLTLVLLLALAAMEASCDDGFNAPKAKRILVKRGARAFLPCGGLSVVKIGDFMTWFRGDKVVATYRIRTCSDTSDHPERGLPYQLGHITYDADPETKTPVNVSIRTDNNNNFEAGSPRVLACIVYGSVPSLNVTWYLGNTMLRPNVYKEVNRGNFTVSSLTFVPSLTDNGKDLVCKATNEFMTENFEDRVTVSVGHRPLCVNDGFKTIGAVQGDSETLVCMVESDPEPEQFIWTFADGRTVYTSSKQKVSGHSIRYSSTLVWVPKDDDYGPLYCRGSNRFGEQKQPCTFSVINGGPPNIPECDIYWEDQETLNINCDKNWDGGRPQSIHLEVKSPEGIRRLSRKGNQLKVNSLHRGANLTLELYATNSRGRSSSLEVTLPPPASGRVPPEQPYTTKEATWVTIMTYVIYSCSILVILFCCFGYYCIYCQQLLSCSDVRSDVVEGSYRRDVEMADFCAEHEMPEEYAMEEAAAIPEPCMTRPSTPIDPRASEKCTIAPNQYYL